MIDIQNINGYGIEDPGFALLREVAHKYCPEEAVEVRQSVLPDETLHLEELEAGFKQLLGGGSGYADLPYIGDADLALPNPAHSVSCLRITASASEFLRQRSCAS